MEMISKQSADLTYLFFLLVGRYSLGHICAPGCGERCNIFMNNC